MDAAFDPPASRASPISCGTRTSVTAQNSTFDVGVADDGRGIVHADLAIERPNGRDEQERCGSAGQCRSHGARGATMRDRTTRVIDVGPIERRTIRPRCEIRAEW
jgi:hypothetical protein